MASRLSLHNYLKGILGSNHVYFQPPSSKELDYPAIVYGLEDIDKTFANDDTYLSRRRYSVTLIDEDPDSQFIEAINQIPMCTFDRPFISDNLNHYVFKLYY